MEDELRNSGIDMIGRVPWGTHFCQFYQTKQDLIDILVPYFKAGLENNEFCMWITSVPLIVAEAQEEIKRVVRDFDGYLRKGQIEIIPYDEWYLREGNFNDDSVLAGWVSKLEQALARGYSGLRLTGNTFWLERNHWQAFTEYEAKVNNVIGKYRMLALCTYCLDKCSGTAVIDVTRNHQFALAKHEGKWDIIESATYKKTKEALNSALEELLQRNRETSALLECAQAILRYKEFKPAARAIFDASKNLIGATGGYVALLSKGGTENEVLFLESGGRSCSVDPTLPMPIRGLRGEIYRTGKAAYDNGFAESKWAKFMPAGHVSLDNILFAPLVLEGRVHGLLGLANKPGGFTENDAAMATAFGKLAAIALLNSRMLESLENSERILRQSEEKYRSLFNNMTEAFALHEIILDKDKKPVDYRFLEANDAFGKITGLSPDTIKGKTIKEVLPAVEQHWIDTYGKVALTGEPVHFENIAASLGQWYEVYAYAPKMGFFATLFKDITERKRVEAEIAHLASFPGLNPNPVLELDIAGNIKYMNPAARKSFLGIEVLGIKHPLLANWEELVKTLESKEFPAIVRNISIGDLWYEQTTTYVPTSHDIRLYVRDITRGEVARQALAESEKDLKHAQAVAHIGSWRLDVRHNQLLWSDESYRIFGIPRGTPLTYETFLSRVHPEDRDYVDKKWTAALQGEDYNIEHRIMVGNEVKWVHERAELEFDSQGVLEGGFGTVRDITERKQIEEKLKQAATEWRTTFDSIADLISIHDRDFKLVGVNKAFADALNMKTEDLIGKNCYEMVHCTDGPISLCPHVKTLETKKPTTAQFFEPRLGVHLEVTTSPVFNEAGEITGSVHVARDITERKKLEQLKDEFIGLVSHELRTPLTVITGCLSTVLTEWARLPAEETQELLRDAVLESESLAHLVENLLELSRVQAQQLTLYPEPTSVKDLIISTVSRIKKQAPSHRFLTSISRGLTLVNADPLRIQRILYNLLENAAKYSQEGTRIRVSARAEPERLVISVSDQGRGLSESEQMQLFQPFHRLEDPGQSRVRGVGLGLLVCRRLVEAHGGEIWIKSQEGKGSTFYFSLPVESKVE